MNLLLPNDTYGWRGDSETRVPSSRGLVKQYNHELCISSITRCFAKRFQSRLLKWTQNNCYIMSFVKYFLNCTGPLKTDEGKWWHQQLFCFVITHVRTQLLWKHLQHSDGNFLIIFDLTLILGLITTTFSKLPNTGLCLNDLKKVLKISIQIWLKSHVMEFYGEGLKKFVSQHQKCLKVNIQF